MIKRFRRRPTLAWVLGTVTVVIAAAVIASTVDVGTLAAAARSAGRDPLGASLALAAYAAAFLLRAWTWRRVVPSLPLGQALAGIHLALGGNHVLPLRLGEPLRVTSVVRRAGTPLEVATASTVTLRVADIAAVAVLALATGPAVLVGLVGAWVAVVVPALALGVVLGRRWLVRLATRDGGVRPPGAVVLAAATAAWLLEAVVMWRAATWAGVDLSAADAVLVTAVTIAAQTVAIAPGGLGTYEAAATAVLVTLGVPSGTALAIALAAHASKTAYALVAGAIATVVPAPGVLGRLRITRPTPRSGSEAPAGPIVVFLPAHDEEAAVGGVVRRMPSSVLGRAVEVIVVDDGSTDATAERAAAAGADVVRHPANRGLGAAVRRGLAEGVQRGAAAVVFLDADGEYAPEELDRLVAPILDGDADYVVGSRFDGRIERMLPHRRVGNLVLTIMLRYVARVPITDGQSGYRALSADAARAAEVIHDFNYAQVLTLDLLAKGFRYAEVPISYRFRETGTSFVRLGRYLRAVLPAVWREVNTAPAAAEA